MKIFIAILAMTLSNVNGRFLRIQEEDSARDHRGVETPFNQRGKDKIINQELRTSEPNFDFKRGGANRAAPIQMDSERSYVDPLTSVEERADNRRREGLQSLDEYERRGWGFRAMGMKNVPRGPPYNSIYPDTRSGDGIRSSSNEMYEVRRQPLATDGEYGRAPNRRNEIKRAGVGYRSADEKSSEPYERDDSKGSVEYERADENGIARIKNVYLEPVNAEIEHDMVKRGAQFESIENLGSERITRGCVAICKQSNVDLRSLRECRNCRRSCFSVCKRSNEDLKSQRVCRCGRKRNPH